MSKFSTLPSVFGLLVDVGFTFLVIGAVYWWQSGSLTEFRSRIDLTQAANWAKAHAEWKRQREGFHSRSIPAKDS